MTISDPRPAFTTPAPAGSFASRAASSKCRVFGVSGSSPTRIWVCCRKASSSCIPANEVTSAIDLRLCAHPLTWYPSARSICAAVCPILPSPITPTRVCCAVRGAANSSHRQAARAAIARNRSRWIASTARQTYSPIVRSVSWLAMRTIGMSGRQLRIARYVIHAGAAAEDDTQVAVACQAPGFRLPYENEIDVVGIYFGIIPPAHIQSGREFREYRSPFRDRGFAARFDEEDLVGNAHKVSF